MPTPDLSVLGKGCSTVIVNGVPLDIMSFQYLLDDIDENIEMLIHNVKKYKERREYTIAAEWAKEAERSEKHARDLLNHLIANGDAHIISE